MLSQIKILSPGLQRRCSGKSSVTFNPGINFLVGPNGSGKSTLLEAIRSSTSGKMSSSRVDVKVVDPRIKLPVFYHTSEAFVKSDAVSDGSNLASLQANIESHGQTLYRYLMGIENRVDQAIFLVDEPEVALSAEALVKFREMLISKVEQGMQFVIATHSPILFTTTDTNTIVFGSNKNYVKDTLRIFRDYVKK